MQIRACQLGDLEGLSGLMGDFSAESGYEFSSEVCRQLLVEFLAKPELGQIWLLIDGEKPAGYLTVCHGFSFMHGGRETFIDEIYIAPEFRRRGWGRKLLDLARAESAAMGTRVLHLEVEDENPRARKLYEQHGFLGTGRRLMTWKTGDGPPISA